MGNALVRSSEMKKTYVLLTGAKNNAGDFLIRQRGCDLLSHLRPDRKLVVLNGWEKLSGQQLTLVNESCALILMGGPAIQPRMYGSVYPLCEDLDDITVPIVTMGVGWKSATGSWADTRRYPFTPETLRLLRKVNDSGVTSSVRDWHTLNVLQSAGFHNFVMTGCPALYAADCVGAGVATQAVPRTVSVSLGVCLVSDTRMAKQTKDLIEGLSDRFGAENVTAVFHHSLEREKLKIYGHGSAEFYLAHRKFADWLEAKKIRWIDISGGVDAMVAHYSKVDMHVGYRVHAHILRLSLNRPSILVAEDGRGRALQSFLGASVLSAGNTKPLAGRLNRVLARVESFGCFGVDRGAKNILAVAQEVVAILENEITSGFPRSRQAVVAKNEAYVDMTRFVNGLP